MKKLKPNIIEQEVIIKNNNPTEFKKIQFFNKISQWFNDPDLEVRVSGLSYIEFCQGVISDGYSLHCISIVSESVSQCEQSFNINYREANGKEHTVAMSPVLDRFQITSQINGYSLPTIEFNGLNTIDYYVQPSTTVRIYFELDKSNTITEAFKVINKINDFSKPVIEQLILNEKVVDCTSCDITPPKIIELPAPDMAKEAKKAMDFKLKIPSTPCKQDPFILEYVVKIKNKGTTNESVSLFNRTTIAQASYRFELPYSSTYTSGFFIEITTDKGIIRYDVTATITRENLVSELNNLNIGTWSIDQSLIANIYTCFTVSNVLSNLFYDQPLSLPVFTVQPISGNGHETGSITLSALATGDAPISYVWRKDGNPILGETNTSLVLNNLVIGSAGSYDCIATNPNGSTQSNIAAVGVYHWVSKNSGSTDTILKVFGL